MTTSKNSSHLSESYQSLAPEGMFHQMYDGFVPRDAQCEMAATVEQCLNDNDQLVVESGTGTGKTFAYLVPLLLTGKRCIISTATKHLQEQIFHRDLPVVSSTLGVPVEAVLLKGRSNYLCRYRLNQSTSQSDFAGSASKLSVNIIQNWANSTRTGDIAEVTEIGEQAPVWRQVTSTADNCLGGKCPDYKKCFVVKARQKALDADIVVVNHHLFFSDLNLKQDGFGELLPNYEAVIFDEAHSLADTASRFFGFSVSLFQIRDLLADIVAAEKEEKSGVAFAEVAHQIQSQLQMIQSSLKTIPQQAVEINRISGHPAWNQLLELQVLMNLLENTLEVGAPAGEGMTRCYQRCLHLQHYIDEWMGGRDRNLVRWLEITNSGFRLQATPLSVSEHFSQMLRKPDTSWVFTSATLAVANDFSAFQAEMGLPDAQTKQWPSPFNFANNALLYLPSDLPDPRKPEFAQQMAETIREVVNVSNGRAFCLFTSYAMMGKMVDMLEHQLSWPVLVQGQAPKSELLQKFTDLGNAVLFGTASFWEGVDVKGDTLSCVIIDKLPFASPGDPVLKSRLAACEEAGGNAFMDIQVPTAVISLKQGAGRLIRSEGDKGVLVLCDQRLTAMRYGKTFLQSLPPMAQTRSFSDVERFFRHSHSS